MLNGLISESEIKAHDLHVIVELGSVKGKKVIQFNEEQIISNNMFSRLFLLCFQ